VPTIYPPVAQAYFTAVAEVTPPGSRSVPIQAAAALCALATTVLLMAGLRRQGRDPRLAVLWAWCPVVGLQFGNGGHVDVLAAFLTAAALFTLARPGGRWRAVAGGALLGLAVATKITPILAGPAVLRRRPAAVLLAAAGATVAVYLPHMLAVGHRVIGFLPAYLTQGGYTTGQHFPLVDLVAPGKWASAAAVLILAAVGVAVLRTADPDRPWRGALVMTGAALAVTTPTLLWYSTLLVVLVAMDGRAEWLALAAARYLTPDHPLPHVTLWQADRLGYGAAIAVIAAVSLLRHRSGRRYEHRRRVTAADPVLVPTAIWTRGVVVADGASVATRG
jgi:Glycosyltransferase family 87